MLRHGHHGQLSPLKQDDPTISLKRFHSPPKTPVDIFDMESNIGPLS